MAFLNTRVAAADPWSDAALESASSGLAVICCAVALMNPGVLIGAGLALIAGRTFARSLRSFLLLACLCAAVGLLLRNQIVLGWPVLLGMHRLAGTSVVIRTLCAEVWFGPAYVLTVRAALTLHRGTVMGQARLQHLAATRRFAGLHGGTTRTSTAPVPHPEGIIRLGRDLETNRHFDLLLEEISEHIFIPGASGMGKTTTIARLAEGVLKLGYGIAIIDCKGSELKQLAKELADRSQLPFNLIDPEDPQTLGYDPCSGDPNDVANKLIGVFSYEGGADIYKQASQEVLPQIARAFEGSGQRATLTKIRDALRSKSDMRRAGRDAGGWTEAEMLRLANRRFEGDLIDQAYLGLSLRLGALVEGRFGPLFDRSERHLPTLDWDAALASPSVTYLALSATASSEDVDLMGKMIAQDLKQVCGRRFRQVAEGGTLTRTLCVMDEFAALNEAQQFRDLLFQSRQAGMPVLISTQQLPTDDQLKLAALSAGLILSHRLAGDNAKQMAEQFGTHPAWKLTVQQDFEKGPTGQASVREVREFHQHPDDFRDLRQGQVAVLGIKRNRRGIVHVYRMNEKVPAP